MTLRAWLALPVEERTRRMLAPIFACPPSLPLGRVPLILRWREAPFVLSMTDRATIEASA